MEWDLELIIKKLDYLFDKLNKEEYNDEFKIYDSICMLILMIESVDKRQLPNSFDKNKFKRIRNKMKRTNLFNFDDPNNNYEIEELIKYEKTINYFNELKMEPEINCVKIDKSMDQFIIMFEDFLKKIDSEIYSEYLVQKKEKRINIISFEEWKKDYVGQCYQVNELNEAYITIPFNNYLHYFTGLAHEFGHLYNIKETMFEQFDPELFYYIEIIPILFELLFRKYMLDNCIIDENEYYEAEMMIIYYNIERSNKIFDYLLINKFSDFEKNESEILKNLSEHGFNYSLQYIEELKSSDCPRQVLYITNYIYALKIFKIYNDNNIKGIELIKKLAKSKTKSDLEYLNLIINENEAIEIFKKYYDIVKEKVK